MSGQRGKIKFELDSFRIIGHRGNEAEDPENTLSAFQRCVSYGIEIAELDVRLSKDGVPIVIHDPKVRTNSGSIKKITDLSAQELTDISIINPHNGTKDNIISLRTLFDFAKNNSLKFQIELKAKGVAKPVIQLIKEYGFESRAYLSSFLHSELRIAAKMAPEISRIFLVRTRDRYPWILTDGIFCQFIERKLKSSKSFGLSIHLSSAKQQVLKYFRDKKYVIFLWGVKSKNQYKKVSEIKSLINGFTAPDIAYWKEMFN